MKLVSKIALGSSGWGRGGRCSSDSFKIHFSFSSMRERYVAFSTSFVEGDIWSTGWASSI